jgi:DNA-binding SARP family transcriptional activator/DNA-binding CsgD family transcriptional regulator
VSATVRAGLLGRQRETDAIAALLRQAREGGSGALVLVGPAGNGKTTLLTESAHLAADVSAPLALLRARGIESEADIPFAGLLELVRPLAGLITWLPEPQARALQGALALAPTESTDRFSVSAATLAILAVAAAEGPLLVLVDDLHWLDTPSAQAILFAARRLWHEGIAILLSTRPEPQIVAQLEGLPLLEIGPLDPNDSAALARASAARELGDEDIEALVAGTGGNPLAIVEAARSIGSSRQTSEGGILPLPVAERIRVGVERRLDPLSPDARRAVLAVAAAGTRAPSTLIDAALAGWGIPLQTLDAAERAGLLRVGADAVEFEHPLTRSAVYAAASGGEQRDAHRALAVASPVGSAERAWHLAAAAFGPDEPAAQALEDVGRDAIGRGAPSSAVRAFDKAAALSVDEESAARRMLFAGDAARLAGNVDYAREVMTAALQRSNDPLMRADALGVLFQIETWRAPVTTAHTIAVEADRLAELDPIRAARMLAEGAAALSRSGSVAQGVEFAERAYAEIAAQGLTDDAVELSLLFARVMDGRAPEAVERLLALGERLLAAGPSAQNLALLQQVAWIQTWVEKYPAAAVLLEHAVVVGRSQAPGTLPMALATRGELGYRTGRWQPALADTTEAASLAGDFGQAHPRGLALTCQARLQACLGMDPECRATAAEAAAIGRSLGGEGSPISSWGSPALGLLELAQGRPERAIPHLERLVTSFHRGGIREPGVVIASGDLVEALTRVGRRDEAGSLLEDYEALAHLTERLGAQAIASRCRGLLAAEGEFEHPFHEALLLHEVVDIPFERVRTQLLFGERLLDADRQADARVQLRDALSGFRRLGAEHWAATAARRLEAAGESVGERPAASPDALTPLELQVALVAASGATSPEAGAQLFMSAKTVEVHLSRIYRKLGVQSQAELAARVAAEDGDPVMVITSLGGFQVAHRGRILDDDDLGGARGRQVFAALLASRGPVLRDELASWIWPDCAPGDRDAFLQAALGDLRDALGAERIAVQESHVQFLLGDADDWDVQRLLGLGRDPQAALSQEETLDALAAFSAPLFPEWPEAEWARPLEVECVAALSRLRGHLADEELRAGRPAEALEHFVALNESDPIEEAWHRGIMRCHAATGDAALALRQYHVCRSALQQWRGQDPGPETRALYLQLLGRR